MENIIPHGVSIEKQKKTVRTHEPRVFLTRWKLLAKSSIFKRSQFLTKINIMVVALKEEKIIRTD